MKIQNKLGKTGSAAKTLAERIQEVRGSLSKYFTSSEVIAAMRRTYKGAINRGAVNAAIESLAKHNVVSVVRRGAGRKDTIWA